MSVLKGPWADANTIVNPPSPPDPPDMDDVAELKAEVQSLKNGLSGVQSSIDKMAGLFDGFKESLRAMQWALGVMLAVGLAAIGWLVVIGNTRVGEISARMDRFLERQVDAASTANARFDRLLEQRASPSAPTVIQVPLTPSPPADPAAPASPSDRATPR